MSTTPIPDAPGNATAERPASTLLVCLPSLAPAALNAMLTHLSEAFSTEELLVATPDPLPGEKQWPRVERITRSNEQPDTGWVLGGAEYSFAAGVAAEREVPAARSDTKYPP